MRLSKPTLRLTITAALAGMTGLAASTITWIAYRNGRNSLLDSYRLVLAQVAERIGERAKGYLGPVKNAAAASARFLESGAIASDDPAPLEALFFAQMAEYHRFASIDFGDDRGNFLMVKRMPDGSLATKSVRRRGSAVLSEWKLRRPEAGLLDVAERRPEPGDSYDPRTRPWYAGALANPGVFWTDVYALASDSKPAVSASVAVRGPRGRQAVASASMTLEEIDRFLASISLGTRGKTFVADRDGRLLGHPAGVTLGSDATGALSLPALRACGDPALEAVAGAPELQAALAGNRAAEMFRFDVGGEPWLGSLVPIAYDVGRGWFVGALVSEQDLFGPLRADLLRTLALCGVVTALGLLFALALGRAIARPLRGLAEEAARIRDLDLGERALPGSPFAEVGEILQAFSGMKVGLRSFEKYVPTKLVRLLLESGEEPRLGGLSRELTILFSDIRGFSTMAEGMPPQELADRLGRYLGDLADIVADAQGTVDKYIGDAVMAFWNAPRPVDDHAFRAVIAALRAVEHARGLDAEGRFHTRVGLHTAEVVVGNFGSVDRLSYTIVGDGVNLAARLEGVNKQYGTQVLMSAETEARVRGRIEVRAVDRIAVKGRARPTTLYEALGQTGQVEPATLERARLYEQALEAYFARDFERALGLFERVLAQDPDDGAAAVMRGRAVVFAKEPPPPGWDGVFQMREK